MNKDLILSLARHILTSVGGVLVTKGVVDSGTVEAVAGGIIALVGFFLFRKAKAAPAPEAK